MSKSKLVMIVEDNYTAADITKKNVEKLGHSAVIFEKGEDALHYVTDSPIKPDLAILDLFLEGAELDGAAVARQMQPLRIPFIVVSAAEDSQLISEVFSYGAYAHFKKPVSKDLLRETISDCLNGKPRDLEKMLKHLTMTRDLDYAEGILAGLHKLSKAEAANWITVSSKRLSTDKFTIANSKL